MLDLLEMSKIFFPFLAGIGATYIRVKQINHKIKTTDAEVVSAATATVINSLEHRLDRAEETISKQGEDIEKLWDRIRTLTVERNLFEAQKNELTHKVARLEFTNSRLKSQSLEIILALENRIEEISAELEHCRTLYESKLGEKPSPSCFVGKAETYWAERSKFLNDILEGGVLPYEGF